MLVTTIELSRKELYEEIWKISVAGVAKKYGIPYAKCLAQIKEAKIPIPPPGYWTKISYGKQVEQTPLQGNEDEVVMLSAEARRYQTSAAEKPEEPLFPVSPQEGTVQSLSGTSSLAEPAAQKPSVDDAAEPADIPLETVQRLGQTYNIYDRETLYKEVWAMPVTEVAKRYHVSDVAIHKVCKSLDIPTPPQGYWAKLRAGKPVKCLPLPPGDKKTKLGIQTTISHPIIDIKQTAAALNISYNTASAAVKKLMELDILKETTNAARNRVFAYERYLKILRKST